MENILLVGANTRAVACSLKKLGYTIYSVDYFGTKDSKSCIDHLKSVLDQKPDTSCGKFIQNFNPHTIREMALELVDEVDGIICCAGSSPSWFHSSKIIGNRDVEMVEDKFSFFQKFKDIFKLPETYLPGDIGDVQEIIQSSMVKKFILKPRYGAGGYGVCRTDDLDVSKIGLDERLLLGERDLSGEIESHEWILQEFIDGENISASVLSTGDEARTILTSTQIIGDINLGQKEPFGYCGNLVPYTGDGEISEIASKVVGHLSLIGSNGVDFISRNGEIYLIEVNPRLQGTFECAELSLDVNMAELHLAACQGHLMEVPTPRRFAVKMVVHAQQRSTWSDLNLPGLCDLPHPKVIIEEGEPMVTVQTSNRVMEDAVYSAKKLVDMVYKSLEPFK
jgi:predicted ATP-grasp superfamily ATP-dependent carboligase